MLLLCLFPLDVISIEGLSAVSSTTATDVAKLLPSLFDVLHLESVMVFIFGLETGS